MFHYNCLMAYSLFWFIQKGGLSAQAFLRIEIEDINDNHPVFNPETYMTSISNHMQPGTEVINVVATDKDSGIYGVVIYELIPGDFSSLFTVDTTTGMTKVPVTWFFLTAEDYCRILNVKINCCIFKMSLL